MKATGAGLLAGEEPFDLQERIEQFRGRQIQWATGRVRLHAIDSTGHPVCGVAPASVAVTQQPWKAGPLPHVSRCDGCLSATEGDADFSTSASVQASDVDIRTAHGTPLEMQARAALRALFDEHDLRRWMFTDLVTIDETVRGGFSHPLTLGTRRLLQRPTLTLTTFLHEQLHWMEGPETEAAALEAARRYPDPPPPPEGAADPRSTWIHFSVCALEYHSLVEIVGEVAAEAEVTKQVAYPWIYRTVLDSSDRFQEFLNRHDLSVPSEIPIPRRYFGETWWTQT